MSSIEQTTFDERYHEFLDSVSGMSFIGKQAERLYEAKEYEKLERFINEVESKLAIEHFYNNDLIPHNDEVGDIF